MKKLFTRGCIYMLIVALYIWCIIFDGWKEAWEEAWIWIDNTKLGKHIDKHYLNDE